MTSTTAPQRGVLASFAFLLISMMLSGQALAFDAGGFKYDVIVGTSNVELGGCVSAPCAVKDIVIPGAIENTTTGVPRAYVPNGLGGNTFMLKVKPGQSVSREQLGALLGEVDARYSVFVLVAASDQLTEGLFAEITTAVTTAVLASLVFLLAGIGLYGILSYGTQLRRFEIGARMAIGATRKHLITMIIVDNTRAVLVGFIGSVILFALAYIGLSEYIQPFLTWQVLPMVIATLALISLVTLFACYWPLRQYINKATIFSLRGSD